jgi:hypothetical protein
MIADGIQHTHEEIVRGRWSTGLVAIVIAGMLINETFLHEEAKSDF